MILIQHNILLKLLLVLSFERCQKALIAGRIAKQKGGSNLLFEPIEASKLEDIVDLARLVCKAPVVRVLSY